MRTVAFCEIDERGRIVLASHWPDIPIHGDVEGCNFIEGEADVIAAGFPCQDLSLAGAGAGLSGGRSGLYRHVIRAIRLVRPKYAVLENVAALLGRGLGQILGDLAEIGYDAEWHCIRASDLGAPHARDRIWIIAYPIGSRGSRLVTSEDIGPPGPWRVRGQEDLQSISGAPFERGDRWPQPLLRRMDDGLPGRVDRLHCIGNAVVPQIVEIIGKAIMQADRAAPHG